MKTPDALLLCPDGDLRPIDFPDGVDHLKIMYEAIGCSSVDVVALTTGIDMWLDDEGMVAREINLPATLLARRFGWVNQPYFGPVLLTGGADTAGDTLPLSRAKAVALLTALADAMHA